MSAEVLTRLKKSVNLPQTAFAMKANLHELEPRMLARWEREGLYARIREARRGGPRYVLHDGPPYASGELHIGTGMNKILKDIVVKYKTMCGYDAPFIPGWDCHGLPIEQKVQEEMHRQKAAFTKQEIRRRSEEFARNHIEGHRRQFKALGVFGRFDKPYLTLDPRYEAAVVDVFLRLVEKGFVYRRRKPVHWCSTDHTALAEAELEYRERVDPSIYLRFASDLRGRFENASAEGGLLVWTTTPWTLFGNVAVAVNPEAEYELVRYVRANREEESVVAAALRDTVLQRIGGSSPRSLGKIKGRELTGLVYARPFAQPALSRPASVVTAPYVSLEDGTGLVHTAPGHGEEDFETSLAFDLPVVSPVDEAGRLTEDVPAPYRGLWVLKANDPIVEELAARGVLLRVDRLTHSYPHCWRCRGPLIFRATAQWFVSVDHEGLRERALAAVREQVKWVPEWGASRIEGMIRERPDWCISRQRAWGIPIPAFYCERCEEPLLNARSVARARELFGREGSNAWFLKSAREILGEGFSCARCGGENFRKEEDIFDVWFESGTSWHAVVDAEPELRDPRAGEPALGSQADLYLEGTDQHRGWFQLSLIPAVGAAGRAPFKTVVTHGFVVAEDGRKMSKSLGNYLSVEDGLKRFSGDMLRLWFSSIDYTDDIAVSVPLIERMRETYRKIRNTFKYMLGNLHDYPGPGAGDLERLAEVDRYALAELERLREEVARAYDEFRFHRVYRLVHEFCAVDMSAVYFEQVRDRLYCERPDEPWRRGTQRVLFEVASVLARLLAPILVFTADEVWEHLRGLRGGEALEPSIHLARFPEEAKARRDPDLEQDFAIILGLRDEVFQAIEPLRKAGEIGESTDVLVEFACSEAAIEERLRRRLSQGGARPFEDALAEVLCVAEARRVLGPLDRSSASSKVPGLSFVARPSPHGKCARCWRKRKDVGARPEAEGTALCARCADVLASLPR